jgi:hypothetical protein
MDEFESIRRISYDVGNQIERADLEMKEIFYRGREIVFRRGNMKEDSKALVISAGHERWTWIYIKNLSTGKKRNISLDDVQGI